MHALATEPGLRGVAACPPPPPPTAQHRTHTPVAEAAGSGGGPRCVGAAATLSAVRDLAARCAQADTPS
jgi:hypothetical protein